jgi:hypothetical protein
VCPSGTKFSSSGQLKAAVSVVVEQISHVVQYHIPEESEAYVHRGGRAGRMGRKGWVTSLVSEKEEFVLTRLANSLKVDLRRLGVVKAAAEGAAGGGGGRASPS